MLPSTSLLFYLIFKTRGSINFYSPIDHQKSEYNRQNNVPEPQEDVGLLVDDVQRQYTQAVVRLYATRRTELVECTLRDAREDVYHWVISEMRNSEVRSYKLDNKHLGTRLEG